MKSFINYNIEDYKLFILPYKHTKFQKVCSEDSNSMQLAHTQFLLDQVEIEINKLKDKRKSLNRIKRRKLKEIFDSRPVKINDEDVKND